MPKPGAHQKGGEKQLAEIYRGVAYPLGTCDW